MKIGGGGRRKTLHHSRNPPSSSSATPQGRAQQQLSRESSDSSPCRRAGHHTAVKSNSGRAKLPQKVWPFLADLTSPSGPEGIRYGQILRHAEDLDGTGRLPRVPHTRPLVIDSLALANQANKYPLETSIEDQQGQGQGKRQVCRYDRRVED